MPIIEAADGTGIRCEILGEGPPLLLIPGLGASSKVWGAFPKAMSAYFKVVSYDPRGFGGSPAAPSKIDMNAMVSDVSILMTELDLGRTHLFGVSMGGIIALRVASIRPESVAKLVLVSTPGRMTPWARKMLDLFEIMARRLPPKEFVEVMAALSMSPDIVDSGSKRIRDLENALIPGESEMECILAQVDAVRSLGNTPLPTDVGAPTLILSGRKDFLTPPSQARELASAIPDAELFSLGGGHACLMENTEEGIVRLLAFLQGESPGATNRV
ncbi:MAG: alpha/beta fold hydrolase, partial [Planctomycetota bacterium]